MGNMIGYEVLTDTVHVLELQMEKIVTIAILAKSTFGGFAN